MRSKILAVVLLVALMAAFTAPQVAGRASAATTVHSASVNSHSAAFDKTKFLFHLALAFGAFHHWVYKPYKAGQLSRRHVFTLIKAALAAGFTYHEVKKAYDIAKGSNSTTLKVVIAPLTGLSAGFSALASKIKGGDTSAVNSLNSQTSSYESLASKNGYSISEQTPTASQLSSTP